MSEVHVARVDVRPYVAGETAEVLLDAGERLVCASSLGEHHRAVGGKHRRVALVELCEGVSDCNGLVDQPTHGERHR